MDMENHNHQQHQYNMPDLRQLLNGRPTTHFQNIPQAQGAPELFSSGNLNLPPPLQQPPPPHHHQFDMMQMVGRQVVGHELMHSPTTGAVVGVNSGSTPSGASYGGGFEGEAMAFGGGDGGTGRWPRQETLTLLEIRSRLDPKFKEANQKGPLWDEVSRIMYEDHGYQRSGKKCREKFENLYKYYKKTKEGKAGRQDGKHYRFFRQLEALYGETSTSVSGQETHRLVGNNFGFHGTQATQDVYHHSQKLCDSLSLSNSFELDPSSSDDNDLSTMETNGRKKKRGNNSRCSWKAKIKGFIDSQMRKLMDRQEAWLEKLTNTLEEKEKERVLREEQWRREEAERFDREHKFWAKERAWIEARDIALMEVLKNLTGKQTVEAADVWQETEVSRLIQLRTTMEGCSEEMLWEEIAAKMACLGFEKSALMCKDKWDSIGAYYLMRTKEGNKKRKENSRDQFGNYHNNNESSLYNSQEVETVRAQANDDSSFRFLMSDGENNYWESYGLKLNNGENQ